MKFIRMIFISMVCCFFSAAGYTDTRIGMLKYDPPYIISPSEGFDVDLSHMLCKELKLTCQWVFINSPQQLYDALKGGQVDLVMSGITISDAHANDFIFSLPYMLSQGQFITLKQSKIKSMQELNGTTVGVIKDKLSGGVLYGYLTHNFPEKFKINQYESIEDMFSALSNKKISAIFLYRSDVNYWNHNFSDMFKTLGPVVTLGKGLAIMATPQQAALITQINKELQDIERDDLYLKLYSTYFSNQ